MILPSEVQDLIDALRREVLDMRREFAELGRESAELRGENEGLRMENGQLRAENAELRRRLDLDSSNSSKPPSSDGLKKKPRIPGSLRGRSGKRSGGQAGHKGGTLRQVAVPDRVERREAHACSHCLAELTASMETGVEARQVFDLPARLIEVTEHQASIYCCAACGGETRADFPEGVVSPAQYGERVRAAAIYLNVQQLIPEDRVAQTMHDLFDAPLLCPASLTAWVNDKGQAFEAVTAEIAARVEKAPVRCLDETGFRIAGQGQWLHTVSTETLTLYRVSAKRGAIPEGLMGGVVVHDHFKPYYRLSGVAHAYCNAHHLRELKALIELDREPWAEPMRDLLLEANDAVRKAREAGATALAPLAIASFVDRYWEAIRLGSSFHRSLPAPEGRARGRKKRRAGHNLIERLTKFKDDVLRFLHDFAVPFTNNLAEQDLRMMKVKMKISGAFRTFAGACRFATLRSVVSTARKQGLNILQALAAQPQTLIHALSA